MVGHSFGGHAFGVLPNHRKVAKFYTFGTGAGWHGWMPPSEQLKVHIMWKILGPLLVKWKGYLAWSKLGMGEDLPLGVFREWKNW
jgi:predicted alpha/beta hydrolase